MIIRNSLAAIALTLTASCSSIEQVPANKSLAKYLSNYDGLSGTVLIADADKITFSASYGLADHSDGRPITDGDIWRWASVTKQIVGVLVMQEVERGAFKLDDTVATLVPDFDTEFASGITVKALLQHTSGLPNPDRLGPLIAEIFEPEAFCSGAAEAKPGTSFSYNNCDYYVLERILEKSSGKSWNTLLSERILQRLNMQETAALDSDLAQTVTGYDTVGVLSQPVDITLFGAAGAIYGNPRDLVKFNHGLMSGLLLSEDALAELWDGDPSLGFVALGAWSFEAPLEGCLDTLKIIERRGYIAGVQARNFMFPETGESIVMFINRGDFDFGEVWMGQGFSYDVSSQAICNSIP